MSTLGYATLQEAWGEAMPPLRRRRKHREAPPVGVANDKEYREARVPGDIEYRAPSAADDYLAWSDYSKELGQRTDAPLPGLDGPERRFPAEAAVSPVPDEPVPVPPPAVPPTVLTAQVQSERFSPTHDDTASVLAGYDVAMYVFTGIMLILLLEQFVQMGSALRPAVVTAGAAAAAPWRP